MPLFEYRCSACGRVEEVLQKHNDPAPDACPHCGAQKTMGKELSLSAFHLKGGGWYKDLYSSSSSSTSTSSSSSSSTETKSETKTETKTEAKPASTPSSGSSGSSSSGSAAA